MADRHDLSDYDHREQTYTSPRSGWHENNEEPVTYTLVTGEVLEMADVADALLLDGIEPESVLQEAERIINGQRDGVYGHPENSFARIRDLWQAYLTGRGMTVDITSQDTALMMILLKVARLEATPNHRDSVVDLAGYAGTIEKLWTGA